MNCRYEWIVSVKPQRLKLARLKLKIANENKGLRGLKLIIMKRMCMSESDFDNLSAFQMGKLYHQTYESLWSSGKILDNNP